LDEGLVTLITKATLSETSYATLADLFEQSDQALINRRFGRAEHYLPPFPPRVSITSAARAAPDDDDCVVARLIRLPASSSEG
jgi:hypothetical protein